MWNFNKNDWGYEGVAPTLSLDSLRIIINQHERITKLEEENRKLFLDRNEKGGELIELRRKNTYLEYVNEDLESTISILLSLPPSASGTSTLWGKSIVS